jgi:hypothetical protein
MSPKKPLEIIKKNHEESIQPQQMLKPPKAPSHNKSDNRRAYRKKPELEFDTHSIASGRSGKMLHD